MAGHQIKSELPDCTDPEERGGVWGELRGKGRRGWLKVTGFEEAYASADEDLPRENDTKTSAVHFLRFTLDAPSAAALKAGAALAAGIELAAYTARVDPVPAALRAALLADLD